MVNYTDNCIFIMIGRIGLIYTEIRLIIQLIGEEKSVEVFIIFMKIYKNVS